MKMPVVLNFGSLNLDYVYSVDHFTLPGETQTGLDFNCFSGGKGLNQSVALARAGVCVYHAGKIGSDGAMLQETLSAAGVHTDDLLTDDSVATGHAIIEVERSGGGNRILLFPGANRSIKEDEMRRILDRFPSGTILLLQNEINGIDFLMKEAAARGFRICINPAPCTPDVRTLPLHLAQTVFVNEIEAAVLADAPSGILPEDLASILCGRWSGTEFILTLGSAGALYAKGTVRYSVPAHPVAEVADTTSAGDTFTGYYLASLLRGSTPEQALRDASRAASITVSRRGAAQSIPLADEVF